MTNHLTANGSSVFHFLLGTNAATIGVRSNLTLAGTVSIGDSGGLGPGTYTIFTNGGSLTWADPVLGTKTAGAVCALDTTTPGKVNLVIASTQPRMDLVASSGSASYALYATGAMANATGWVLNSTNVALRFNEWTRLVPAAFDAAGSLRLTNLPMSNTPASLNALQVP